MAQEKTRVFWSGHLTAGHQKKRQEWMAPLAEEDADVRASMPPFNNANKLAIPERVKRYNVPAFGPNISNAVMDIFTVAEIRSTADSLNVQIPPYVLSKFVQDKMVKVLDMVAYCEKIPMISAKNADATQKLKGFVEEFQKLGPSIKQVSDWEAFVNKHAKPGWQGKMHFDHLLSNFGFENEASDLLRQTEFEKEDGEKVTFEQHSFRWLSKALGAYGPEGALTDVVNLTFAMTEQEFDGLTDSQIADKIREFKRKVEARDLSGLWIPNHFFMDAESDDCLAWALLQHVSQLQGTASEFKVLIQLPPNPELDPLAQKWSSKRNCEVWRDPHSRNANAVTRCHSHMRADAVSGAPPDGTGAGGGGYAAWACCAGEQCCSSDT